MTRLIDADELKKEFDIIASKSAISNLQTIPISHIKQIIDHAPTVNKDSPNFLKKREGQYVTYRVDYLLDNLAREIYLLEAGRRLTREADNE